MYNILIAEDELLIRQSILHEIEWDRLELNLAGEACNGKEALDVLERKTVDIIITDMKMPLCDGRELLQSIEEKGYDCEIIVLSEYTDFTYMQQAIHAHVADYLLKPINPCRMNEVLEKACIKVEEKRHLELNVRDPLDRIYIKTIKNTPLDQMTDSFLSYKRVFKNKAIQIALICIGTANECYDSVQIQKRLEEYCGSCPFKTRIRPFHEERGIFSILTLLPMPITNRIYSTYNLWLKDFFKICLNEFRKKVRIGTTYILTDIQKISSSLQSANVGLKFLNHGKGEIIWYENVSSILHAEYSHPMYENVLAELISKKKDLRSQIIDLFLQTYCSIKYLYIPFLQKNLIDFAYMIEQLCQEQGVTVNVNELMETNCVESIRGIEWISEVKDFLEKLLNNIWSVIHNRRTLSTEEIIKEIISTMQTQYMEELSLMNFSQRYYINYIYLSRQFKIMTGDTFSDYLQKIRMEKARIFIEQKGYNEKTVAAMVGFHNPYYFISAYDKYNGLQERGKHNE